MTERGSHTMHEPAGSTWTVTHYDLLDVDPSASPAEVKAAFDDALALLEGRALAGYALLSPDESASIRAQLDVAFEVLSDTAARAAYDGALAQAGRALRAGDDFGPGADDAALYLSTPPPAAAPEVDRPAPPMKRPSTGIRMLRPVVAASAHRAHAAAPPRPPTVRAVDPDAAAPSVIPARARMPQSVREEVSSVRPLGGAPRSAPVSDDRVTELLNVAGAVNGALIQRLREARGLSLEVLAEKTRVRKGVLRAIESGERQALPERVYLRGFLLAIARALRVDKERLVQGYLAYARGDDVEGGG